MASPMVYYLAWQEDDWLDELIDYFPEITALVPTHKNLQLIRAQQEQVDRAIIIVNPAGEEANSEEFMRALTADEQLSNWPIYLVGIDEQEVPRWQSAFPQAEVIAISGFLVEFDFPAVFARMEAKWEEAR